VFVSRSKVKFFSPIKDDTSLCFGFNEVYRALLNDNTSITLCETVLSKSWCWEKQQSW